MRIAIVIHEYPPIGGGAATAAAQTARALAADGNEVLVVTGGGRGLAAEEGGGRLTVRRLAGLRLSRLAPSGLELLSFCVGAALGLERQLRRFGAEGVIAYFAVPAGPFAVRAARRMGVPVVVSLRGSDVPGFRHGRLEGPIGPLARPVVRWTLARADAVAPNSEALSGLAAAFAPDLATRLVVIPNGIEEEAIAAGPASSGASELRLVQVGQLIARKRVAVTLGALARLVARGVGARLTVIGEGPLGRDLEGEAEALGVRAAVDFAGHLGRAEILARLRRHDVFVMTSAAEGMSNAVLEAMAAGLPIVMTENGSHDLVARAGAGVVLPEAAPEPLAQVLAGLAGDPARRRALAEAGLAAARTLTWAASARAFVELLSRGDGRASPRRRR